MRLLLFFLCLAAGGRAVAGTCNAEPDPALAQYIVGYGSLMQDESRLRTSPNSGPAHPVELSGYRRGWFAKTPWSRFGTTFLGAVEDREGRFNAVVYQVDAAELAATDRRERGYCRAAVELSALRLLEPQAAKPAGQAWIYVLPASAAALAPDAEHPIVQSYVDIFVSGCLDQERRFRLPGFARACLSSTAAWSAHWVNDRIYPRRPFAQQPRAREIDELLEADLKVLFDRVRIESSAP
jgi:hypothetical protein